jgi:hypothetical protein
MKSTQASLQASMTSPKKSSILTMVIFTMQAFIIGCEMYNKIDPSFSLCILDKGQKDGGEHLMILVCLSAN